MTTPIFSGGILLPVQPNGRGGFKLIEGDDYLMQLVIMRAAPGESDNPFLDIGIGEGAIFQNASDAGWLSVQRTKIEAFFRNLERAQLARLKKVSFRPGDESAGEDPADFFATIRFLSIETNTELEVDTAVRRT